MTKKVQLSQAEIQKCIGKKVTKTQQKAVNLFCDRTKFNIVKEIRESKDSQEARRKIMVGLDISKPAADFILSLRLTKVVKAMDVFDKKVALDTALNAGAQK